MELGTSSLRCLYLFGALCSLAHEGVTAHDTSGKTTFSYAHAIVSRERRILSTAANGERAALSFESGCNGLHFHYCSAENVFVRAEGLLESFALRLRLLRWLRGNQVA